MWYSQNKLKYVSFCYQLQVELLIILDMTQKISFECFQGISTGLNLAFSVTTSIKIVIYIRTYIYRVSQEESARLRRVFLMLNYTDITQNTHIQSWTVTEIMAREVWNFGSCYTLIDYQIHIKTGRNMWFL